MDPAFQLTGKNIVITGASSGIGKHCALMCARQGAHVVLMARDEDKLKKVMRTLEGDKHLLYARDITSYESLETVIGDAVAKIGPVDGFIHSAGAELTLPFRSLRPQDYEKLLRINTIAGFELARIVTKKKHVNQNGASLVFVGSVLGLLGRAGATAYCMSKGALMAGVKAVALELVSRNIRVNCVLPGVVETPMTEKLMESIPQESKLSIVDMHPMGLGRPEDVAHACVFLLSDAARWITGTGLIVDGGYSMA